ncbi:transposase [Cereibacter sphaeroides]|uniref:transposase n=1 Tax=Cereibacter sphaeroides TaxID=1063 RepID=UPI001F233963|nr:transposase [Cereibacter sphaeroides]MCE6949530.1 transposase [Cereibacter sphaeroides]
MADGGDGGALLYSVISGPTGGRQWPDEVKARIVAESFAPGVRVGDVARRHGVLPSQLTTWRGVVAELPPQRIHITTPWR